RADPRDPHSFPTRRSSDLSPQAGQRRQAALALGQLGESARQAVSALTKLLDDGNELVRRQAAESLGRFGMRARPAVGKLCGVLEDRKSTRLNSSHDQISYA